MGCLRLGWAFIGSLFLIAVFTILGGLLGTFIYSLVASHEATIDAYPGLLIGGGFGLVLGLYSMIVILKRVANSNRLKSYGISSTSTTGGDWVLRQQEQQRQQEQLLQGAHWYHQQEQIRRQQEQMRHQQEQMRHQQEQMRHQQEQQEQMRRMRGW